MSKKKDKIAFRIGAFSTDNNIYNIGVILKEFFNQIHCQNVEYSKPTKIDFDYKYSSSLTLHTNFIEITNLTREHKICSCADAFILMVDMEKKDSSNELKAIKEYVDMKCSYNKKIYIMGMYKDKSKISTSEDEIRANFSTNFFTLNFREICIGNPEAIVSQFRDIFKETLEGKDCDDGTAENPEDGQSQSRCIVF